MEEKELHPEVEQEEQTNEEAQPETEQEVDYEAQIEEAKAEAAKWKAIAERNRKKTKSLPNNNKEKEVDEDIVATVKSLELIEKKRQFGFENDLSPEETDFIFKFANGKPDVKTLENPFIKAGLEGFRQSKKLERNTPSTSRASSVFGGKDFKEMSQDERAKAFEEKMKSIRK